MLLNNIRNSKSADQQENPMIILEGRRNICIKSKCPLNGSGLFKDYDVSERHSYVRDTKPYCFVYVWILFFDD